METLFGLPAHALLIHAPIVLLPIVALVTIAIIARPTWRERLGWWVLASIFSVVVMLYLAKTSGEAFDDAFDGAVDVSRHEELANMTFVLTLLWFAAFAALQIYEAVMRRPATNDLSSAAAESPSRQTMVVTTVLGVVVVLLAILATIWLVRTGHEGADVVWGDTTDFLFGD